MGTAFDAELHEQTEQLIIHVPEEATPGQSLTQRRVATRWILITPVAIVVLCTLAALSYGPSTVAELSTSTEEVEEIVQEPGYPQQPREWLSEDEELRHYAWTTPQPHTSLQDVLDSLNPVRYPYAVELVFAPAYSHRPPARNSDSSLDPRKSDNVTSWRRRWSGEH